MQGVYSVNYLKQYTYVKMCVGLFSVSYVGNIPTRGLLDIISLNQKEVFDRAWPD